MPDERSEHRGVDQRGSPPARGNRRLPIVMKRCRSMMRDQRREARREQRADVDQQQRRRGPGTAPTAAIDRDRERPRTRSESGYEDRNSAVKSATSS